MKRFGQSTLKKARRLHPTHLHNLGSAAFHPAEFNKDTKHIISYDPHNLFNYGFVNPKGSVLNPGMVLRTVFMCVIGTIASLFRCADVPTSYSFCFPVIISTEGLIFASLVAFLLGLFISTTFSRWWTTREKLGTIMNNTTTLTMMLINFAPKDPEIQAAAKTLLRWMHLAHSMVYKHANDDVDYNDLVEAKVATQAEADRLTESKGHNLPAIVYGWCFAILPPLISTGKVVAPLGAVTVVLACITGSFNASQELHALLSTQMPYAYLHLLTVTTKVHLAFVVFYAGGVIAGGISGHLWTRIIFGYTIIITNNIIYEGLLRIHAMLVNPLGDDDGDFPTHLYVSNTLALCNALQAPPPKEDIAQDTQGPGVTVPIV
jgi:predicted membrane chloride channel (bestrophin family)